MSCYKKYIAVILMLILSFSVGFFLINGMDMEFEPFEYVFETSDSPILVFFEILFNNLIFCAFLMFGIGIITVPLVLWQGFQLGAMCSLWLSTGNTLKDYILLLLPHGIVEFTALTIFSVMGLELFVLVKKAIKGEKISFRSWVCEHKSPIIVGVSLIFVAAIIETVLTPYLFNVMR